MKTTNTYGSLQPTEHVNVEDSILEALDTDGFFVLKNVFSKKDMQLACDKLEEVYQVQCAEVAPEILQKIFELNTVRAPCTYDSFFLDLIFSEKLMLLANKILGDYFILNLQNGIINPPHEPHHQATWHRDFPYFRGTTSHPLGLGAMIMLDDFTTENGATRLVPHSHRLECSPSIEYIERNAVSAIGTVGDVLLFNPLIIHASGFNETSAKRRGLNQLFSLPMIKPQFEFCDMMDLSEQTDFVQRVLGKFVKPARSVKDWRKGRLKN